MRLPGLIAALVAGGLAVAAAADKEVPTWLAQLASFGFTRENLAEAFSDPRPEVRRLAVRVVGEEGSREHVSRLTAALGDTDAWVRVLAAGALTDLGIRPELEVLRAALAGGDTDLAVEAADHLAASRDREAFARLVTLLRDPHLVGSARAARVAGKYLGPDFPDGSAAFRELATDTTVSAEVRRVVVELLAGDRTSPEVLALMRRLESDADPVIRGLAKQYVEERR